MKNMASNAKAKFVSRHSSKGSIVSRGHITLDIRLSC